MTASDLLRGMVEALEAAGIPYMATGSFASSQHGRPRATQDFDLVIAPTAEQLKEFIRGLPTTRYYVVEEAALDALGAEDQFNVLDIENSGRWISSSASPGLSGVRHLARVPHFGAETAEHLGVLVEAPGQEL